MWKKDIVFCIINRTNQKPKAEAIIVDDYGKERTRSKREEFLQNELERIRNSATFRFGNLFVKAFERPWKIILLPITIPIMIFKILSEKNAVVQNNFEPTGRNCIVFFSAKSRRGLHFDRCQSMIDELNDGDIQIVHVTTESNGVFTEKKNVHHYIFPERSDFQNMNPNNWNYKCEVFLNAVFDIFTPATFIFDGDFPFRGVVNSMDKRDYMNRFWVRESSSSYNISSLPLDSFEKFDAIIHPSFAKKNDPDTNIGSAGTLFCNPIISKVEDDKPRDRFREKHIPMNSKLVFFDVGKLNSQLQTIAEQLLERDYVYLLIRPNITERSIIDHPRVIVSNGLNYTQSMHYSDSVVLFPDHFCIHTAFYLKKPILSIIKEELAIGFLKEEIGTTSLPIIYIDPEDVGDVIHVTLERFLSEEVQQQLIERLDRFEVHPGTQKLGDFIMEYHN